MIDSDSLEIVQGDILPPENIVSSDPSDLLPPSINDDIKEWLLEYAQEFNLDLSNCSNLQWRAACIYVGRKLQASGILFDMEKLRQRGGTKYYKPEVIAALVPVWEWFSTVYKHIPLACDFISFTGVSREWFYDSGKRQLTSTRVDLLQKVRAIEEGALSAALVDHRENPTGRIYYTKARLGWQETTTIQHVSASSSAPAPVSLPMFNGDQPKLPQNGT